MRYVCYFASLSDTETSDYNKLYNFIWMIHQNYSNVIIKIVNVSDNFYKQVVNKPSLEQGNIAHRVSSPIRYSGVPVFVSNRIVACSTCIIPLISTQYRILFHLGFLFSIKDDGWSGKTEVDNILWLLIFNWKKIKYLNLPTI